MNDSMPSQVPERRRLVRQRVGICADLIQPGANENHDCYILDATREGCRIFCESTPALPVCIFLHPKAASKPIRASIVWRKGKNAGIKLDWTDTELI